MLDLLDVGSVVAGSTYTDNGDLTGYISIRRLAWISKHERFMCLLHLHGIIEKSFYVKSQNHMALSQVVYKIKSSNVLCTYICMKLAQMISEFTTAIHSLIACYITYLHP